MSRTFALTLYHSFLDFIFPPFCEGCKKALSREYTFLCQSCIEELSFINIKDHCRYCFAEKTHNHICKSSSLAGYFACLYDGPEGRALLTNHTAACASLMLLQMCYLKWQTPDVIMITPGNPYTDSFHSIKKNLASGLAALMDLPLSSALRLEYKLLPHPYQHLEFQSGPINKEAIVVSNHASFVNKKVLLIHDINSTFTSIETSAQALKCHGALSVYALSFLT